jgi:drug/metabolite transporter (DMT)-like permease
MANITQPIQGRIHPLKILSAFTAIYFIWGSTFLALKFVVADLPPFLFSGVRFLIAGSILFLWTRSRSPEKPTLEHWKAAAVSGFLLLLIGHGFVVWAIQFMPSGLAALLVATEPVWVVVLGMFFPGYGYPSVKVFIGLVIGLVGISLLVNPFESLGSTSIEFGAASMILFATIAWAVGSLYSSRAAVPKSSSLAVSMKMLCGGVFLVLGGIVSGELAILDIPSVSLKTMLSFTYLVIFGSLIAFSAFDWLLRNVSPTLVATHAYVNPVVAMILGFLVAAEILTTRDVVSAVIILAGVVLITTGKIGKGKREEVVSETFDVVPADHRQLKRQILEQGCAAGDQQ